MMRMALRRGRDDDGGGGGVGRRGHDDDEGRGCRDEEAAGDEADACEAHFFFSFCSSLCVFSPKKGDEV